MAMNDEVNEKSINLAVRVGQLTAGEIKRAIEKLIADLSEGNYLGKNLVESDKSTEPKHGKMTLNTLKKQNDGLTPLELTDPNLRLLNREMKRAKIAFAVEKDGKGKFILYFKGKDADEMTLALKKYTQKLVKLAKTKPSIGKELAEAKEAAKALNVKLEKVKDRSKGARDR